MPLTNGPTRSDNCGGSALCLQALRRLGGQTGHIGARDDLVREPVGQCVLHRRVLAERGHGLHIRVRVEHLAAQVDGHHGEGAEQGRHEQQRTGAQPPAARAQPRLAPPGAFARSRSSSARSSAVSSPSTIPTPAGQFDRLAPACPYAANFGICRCSRCAAGRRCAEGSSI